jgi:hypothetical protein
LFEDDERLMEMRRARGHAFAFNKRESQSAAAFVPASALLAIDRHNARPGSA